jgi:hypothetical protein
MDELEQLKREGRPELGGEPLIFFGDSAVTPLRHKELPAHVETTDEQRQRLWREHVAEMKHRNDAAVARMRARQPTDGRQFQDIRSDAPGFRQADAGYRTDIVANDRGKPVWLAEF